MKNINSLKTLSGLEQEMINNVCRDHAIGAIAECWKAPYEVMAICKDLNVDYDSISDKEFDFVYELTAKHLPEDFFTRSY
jgi:hypothetical protein|tara:strand:+ start:935 stop:1174 length:240 start_codon:yes stop_codon:yes gene_type:complete